MKKGYIRKRGKNWICFLKCYLLMWLFSCSKPSSKLLNLLSSSSSCLSLLTSAWHSWICGCCFATIASSLLVSLATIALSTFKCFCERAVVWCSYTFDPQLHGCRMYITCCKDLLDVEFYLVNYGYQALVVRFKTNMLGTHYVSENRKTSSKGFQCCLDKQIR